MVKKILVIIESPGKVHTLSEILGSKYLIMASVGHIRDLDPKKMSIDIEHDFEPTYKILPDKIQIVQKLKEAYAKASDTFLCLDMDNEGANIAWSIAQELGIKKPKRAVYNSVTKEEVLNAIANPTSIDMNQVDAQKARRIIDRLMGYELSPLLLSVLKIQHLSAGRVQSVVTRLIVDKEEEIKKFFESKNEAYFKFTAEFTNKKDKFMAQMYHVTEKKIKGSKKKKEKDDTDSDTKEEEEEKDDRDDKGDKDDENKGIVRIYDLKTAKDIMKTFTTSKFKVGDIQEREGRRNPSPPFTTSTLQQEAGRKLGFNVKRTMQTAQNLYESGYITYMRTDSINLSNEAIENIKKYVIEKYGKEYHKEVHYKAKTKNTQEAHEAIRPTNVFMISINGGKKIGNDEIKLYSLIWKRAVASQMVPAIISMTTITIDINKLDQYKFIAKFEVVKFAGFLAVYNIKNIDENDEESPILSKKMEIGTVLGVNIINGTQEYKKPPSRYNEVTLVNKLDPKNLNIGRPSTYASIISKIQERGYVKKGDIEGVEKDSIVLSWDGTSKKITEDINTIMLGKEIGKLIPEDLGVRVTKFLMQHFPDIMDYQFTAHMEDELDDIADGKIKWVNVVKKFYDKFHPIIVKISGKAKELSTANTKILGKYPDTDQDIVVMIGKYGPYVQWCKDKKKDCIKAPVKAPLTFDTITLEGAIKLFEYPKNLGKYDKKDVLLKIGKFGLYLNVGKDKYPIKDNDENIDLDSAIKIMEGKKEEKKKATLWEDKDKDKTYTVLEGPYGKYIKVTQNIKKGKAINAKLPKDTDLAKLTLEKAKEIVDASFKNKSKFRKFTKKGVKKV